MTTTPTGNARTTGAFNAKPTTEQRRKDLKYRINTASTTATGVVPIRGATKYPEEPEIFFTREAWVKQCHLVSKCQKEVGWFALVDYDEEHNNFTITEIVIPKQEVTAIETDIGKEAMADAAMELIEAGKDTSKMYAWFHSHVDMAVSPSGQDEYQVEDFLQDLADQPEVPAFIRGIQNKKGDLKLDVYYIQHGVAYQNVEFYVIHDDDPQWKLDIEAEIRTKVSERKTFYGTNFGGSFGTKPDTKKNLAAIGNVKDTHNDDDDDFWNDNYMDMHGYDDLRSHPVVATTTIDDDDELFDGLIPVPLTPNRWWDMDIVHKLNDASEIVQDTDGTLYVSDSHGELYSYDEFVEKNGAAFSE